MEFFPDDMPYSFTQIEKDKTSAIGIIFSFLLFLYFLFVAAVIFMIQNQFGFWSQAEHYSPGAQAYDWIMFNKWDFLMAFFFALLAALIHWSIINNNLIPKLFRLLKARQLNALEVKEKFLINIIDEIKVATKTSVSIEGLIIPSNALNSFALSDFEGNNFLGVTQGLLDKLSRAQLEAVIAHEAAHVLTNDCLVTTISSSVFGLCTELSDTTSDAIDDFESPLWQSGYLVFLAFFLNVVFYIAQTATFLMGMFISRQREFRADAIAVRLTRDPLSLAEALYLIDTSLYGSRISGKGISAIFIVSPRKLWFNENTGLFADLFATHPPVNSRLKILLDMAHENIDSLRHKFLGKYY